MKLAPLLARYLYTHRRMELPGLGFFTLDASSEQAEKPAMLTGVHFQNDPSIKESPDLVRYISEETGKMKALAAADLDSHLQLAHQFLNIGKPFLLDGIGNLVKLRGGEYAFTPGEALPEIMPQKTIETDVEGKDNDDYKSIFYGTRARPSLKKAVTLLLAIAGIGVAVVGGYTVYKKTQRGAEEEPQLQSIEFPAPEKIDTIQENQPVIASPVQVSQKRKFVLETAKARRAFARYNKLKSFQWNVEMETSDSVLYKLYVMVPASIMDTTRILDSLTRMNGKRVHME